MLYKPSYMVGPYRVSPHPKAPLFDDPSQAAILFPQAIAEMTSTTGGSGKSSFDLIRQLGFVSLSFFVNSFLRPFGPYEGLDDPLSLDMMNFRQDDCCLEPGAKSAMFMPRGFSKSRTFTHGPDTWDLIRDPDEAILIVNAIDEKAHEFLHQISANFTSNEAIQFFYPEYVPSKDNGGLSTQKILVLPNRTVSSVEPSVKALGMTGASEGGHYSLISIDDLVGLDALDSNRQATVVMETAKKWFRTNTRALRRTNASRVLTAATRYAVDDCYQDIYESCKQVRGWTQGDLQPVTDGEWTVYYRLVEENGTYLRPQVMDAKALAKLMHEDYWSAMCNYYNSPQKAGLAEFAQNEVLPCSLLEDDETHELWIRRDDPNGLLADEETMIRLGSCNVMVVTDLAATDRNMNAKTCRTAIEVWAKDAQDRCYLIWARVGFFSIFESFDHIFHAHQILRGIPQGTIIETNAFQKVVKPLLEHEQIVRDQWIHPIPVNAAGDKKARIRLAFGTYLLRNAIYATTEASIPLLEELKMFPMSDKRLDTLDAAEKALVFIPRPDTMEEKEYQAMRDEERNAELSRNAVGY